MITRTDHPTWTVTCDAPSCPTQPIETVTDTGLAGILRGLQWLVLPDGRTYCPIHASDKIPGVTEP